MLKTTDSCGVNSGSSDTHPIRALNTDQTSITQRHGTYTKAYTQSAVLHQINFEFASVSTAITYKVTVGKELEMAHNSSETKTIPALQLYDAARLKLLAL